MKTITTTFFSTLDKDQTKDCLKLLLLPWKWGSWKRGKYIKEAEDKIRDYLNEPPQSLLGDCGGGVAQKVFSFYNGRAALYYALRVAGAGVGDEVIIQAYTCVTVPNAVLATGAKPIYCDIDESLNLDPEELKKKITDKTKVVIVQHTFGNPAKIEEIRNICEGKPHPNPLLKGEGVLWRKIFLIEDCAHSLGAKYNGRLVGTFGDISMFSFGRDKVISSVNGGMLCVNNKALMNNEAKNGNEPRHSEPRNEAKNPEARGVNNGSTVSYGILPPPGARGQDDAVFPSIPLIIKNLMYPIIAQISLKWYNKLNIGKVIMYVSKKLKLFPLILSKEENHTLKARNRTPKARNYLMPNVLAYLFLHQFEKLEKYNEHRRKIANYYNEVLAGSEFKLPRIWNESEPVYLRYTVFTAKAVEILKEAREKDIYLGDWYRNVIAPKGVNLAGVSYEQNMCSTAEKYSEMTLNLPNHTGINLDDARRVVGEIKNSPN